MSNYTKNTDFQAIDDLAPGDPGKKILGTAWSAEFDEIETVIATKADKADVTFTGTTAFADLQATTLEGSGLLTAAQTRLTGPVAFYAYDGFQAPTTSPEVLTFPSELFDLGSAFDTSTGTFTAPYTGIYFFSAQATFQNQSSTGKVRGYIYLYHNTTQISNGVVCTPSGSASNLQFGANATRVVHMTAGDTMKVRFLAPDTGATFWHLYNTYFSGVLLART